MYVFLYEFPTRMLQRVNAWISLHPYGSPGAGCLKEHQVNAAAAKSLQSCPTMCRFSHVRLCATPQTAAHQAPLSLGFSRQEHWSGLPFPSIMHACMHAKSLQSVLTLCDSIDGSPPLATGFSGQEYWNGLPFPSLIR